MSTAMRSLSDAPERLSGPALYEFDEHAWIKEQVAALRSGRLGDLDRVSLAEYLTDMTKRDYRELQSRLTVLLQHLLKIRLQPARMTRSWVNTISTQQNEIRLLLHDTPSMAQHADERFAAAYRNAVSQAASETGIATAKFPVENPWTLDEALAFEPPPVRLR